MFRKFYRVLIVQFVLILMLISSPWEGGGTSSKPPDFVTSKSIFGTKYSRMDQVKFVLPKADHTPSNLLKAVFHKFYLVHS